MQDIFHKFLLFLYVYRTCKSDSALRSFASGYRPPRGSDKIRTASGPSVFPRHEDINIQNDSEVCDNFSCSVHI